MIPGTEIVHLTAAGTAKDIIAANRANARAKSIPSQILGLRVPFAIAMAISIERTAGGRNVAVGRYGDMRSIAMFPAPPPISSQKKANLLFFTFPTMLFAMVCLRSQSIKVDADACELPQSPRGFRTDLINLFGIYFQVIFMNQAKGMGNMQMAAIGVVVLIVVVGGILVLSGTKSTPTATTTVSVSSVPGASTTQETTVASVVKQNTEAPVTLQSLAGKNLTLTQLGADIGNSTYETMGTLNASYFYAYSISLSSPITYSSSSNGTTTIRRYNKDSRIDSTANVAGQKSSTSTIFNSTSGKEYSCSSLGASAFSCKQTSANVSIWSSAGGVGFLAGQQGSGTNVTGYFSNIALSNSSYNGMPCILVKGNLYVDVKLKSSSAMILNGTLATCITTQYHTWLTQHLVGTAKMTVSGQAATANIVYSMNETALGGATSAAITALPGPLTS